LTTTPFPPLQKFNPGQQSLGWAWIYKFFLVGLLGGLLVLCSGCRPDESLSGAASGRTTLQLATWGSAEEVKVLRTLLDRFERVYPELQVDLLHIPDQYYQKLHILIAGGLVPDVIFTNSLYFPVYAESGVFQDLRPFVAESPEVQESDFFPSALAAFAWTNPGEPPMLGALPRDVSNLVVYYNRSLFREAGVRDPSPDWTWEDFLQKAQALTQDRNGDGRLDQFGVSFNRVPPLFWLPFVWSAGGELFDPGFQQILLTSPQAMAGLQFYADLRNKHHVAPRQVESGSATMSQLFLQQKIAMMLSGRWSVPVFREQAGFDWDVVPFPQGAVGSRVGIDASGYAMAAKTKHPQAAWALIAFLTSQEAIAKASQSGLIVPARQDVAASGAFLNPDLPPRNSQAFIEAIPTGVPTHTPPRWNEVAEVLGLALDPVWDGKKTVEQAMEGLDETVKPLLPQGGGR